MTKKSILIYQYPKCSTCREAIRFLRKEGIAVEERHIVEEPPSREEMRALIEKSGLPIQRFFNTSGMRYRELGLSKTLKGMSDEEKLAMLVSDGMLIKRPIATDTKKVTVGFKEQEWAREWLNPSCSHDPHSD